MSRPLQRAQQDHVEETLADERAGETSLSHEGVSTAVAASSRGAFLDAIYRRVRDVDDATMSHLLRLLLRLRRIKNVLGGLGFLGGGLFFGLLPIESPMQALLIHSVLAAMVGVPTLAAGSLAVRRIFLKEARRLGLSRSTAMLLLTRAERRARFMLPATDVDERVEQLIRAVHAWDQA